MTLALSRSEIIERRSVVIERGAPQADVLLDRVASRIERAGVAEITTFRRMVHLGGWLGPARDALIVTHRAFPDLRVCVSTEVLGVHLEMLQLVALQPGVFKRLAAGWLTRGAWWSWSMPKGVGAEERCRAFLTLVGSCVDGAARSLVRRIGRGESSLERRVGDVLDVWL
jgi:hypothetical protein